MRHSLTSIQELLIDTPSGDQVPLGRVADVRIAPSPVSIERDAISRYMDVVADVEGREVGAVAGRCPACPRRHGLPDGVSRRAVDGLRGAQADALRLLGVLLAIAIGIFLILQAAFRSWRLAAVSMVVLPVALVGGVFAACVFEWRAALGSMIGFSWRCSRSPRAMSWHS